ncbi:hypothetical protein [Williamsia sp. CHRR-6]|uniref:hypothetical protein n=1 Tax=Williamsia sp. CHRR-6 TaxID=2835871 RepID=UPI001BD9E980|nr:hypothetical protein [Williamsia sp. CHRR-6]MBT0568286.1 hypothetical protein [Williamsia sp. CHRR-6]
MSRRAWAVVIATAGVVMLLATLATRETMASWSRTQTTTGATITSGILRLTANGSDTVDLAALGGSQLRPGAIRTRSLTLANAGDARLAWKLTSATASSPNLTLSASALSGGAGQGASDCDGSSAATLPGTALTTASPARTLTKGASTLVCLRATISAAATSGATYTATFTFGGVQT